MAKVPWAAFLALKRIGDVLTPVRGVILSISFNFKAKCDLANFRDNFGGILLQLQLLTFCWTRRQ